MCLSCMGLPELHAAVYTLPYVTTLAILYMTDASTPGSGMYWEDTVSIASIIGALASPIHDDSTHVITMYALLPSLMTRVCTMLENNNNHKLVTRAMVWLFSIRYTYHDDHTIVFFWKYLYIVAYVVYVVTQQVLWFALSLGVVCIKWRLYRFDWRELAYGVVCLGYAADMIDAGEMSVAFRYMDIGIKTEVVGKRCWELINGKEKIQLIRRHCMSPRYAKRLSDSIVLRSAREDLFDLGSVSQIVDPVHTFETHRMAIVFLDRVNFSEWTRVHADHELVSVLHDMHVKLDTLCMRYGMYKVDTFGDGYYLVGPHITDAYELCVDAGTELGPEIRIGLHVGYVIRCIIGLTKLRVAYIGHDVNVASRLEAHAPPGGVCMSAEARYELEVNGIHPLSKDMGMLDLKGVGRVRAHVMPCY